MKVMVVGNGGREHALAWKVSQSPLLKHLYIAPGNPGTAELGTNVPLAADDIRGLAEYATAKEIDVTIVGPEQPLSLGIVDLFREKGLACFGPTMASARVETSKVFAKELMERAAVPTAGYRAFTDPQAAMAYVRHKGAPLVVKADGLAAGKGVIVAHSVEQALDAIQQIMVSRLFGEAGSRLVVEEFLEGREVSVLAICNGRSYCLLPPSQDHKTAYDGDEGPNTGGMGAYSPVPWFDTLTESLIRDKVVEPLLWALTKQGTPYTGVLYCGLMLTQDGPKVLEINARSGDPETQALMPVLDIDLMELVMASVKGNPQQYEPRADGAAVCVVMASAGYPGPYQKGIPVQGIDKARSIPGTEVFHAGTAIKGGQLVTSGGRVLGVTSRAGDLKEAVSNAYKAVSLINFDGAHYRKDIALKGLSKT